MIFVWPRDRDGMHQGTYSLNWRHCFSGFKLGQTLRHIDTERSIDLTRNFDGSQSTSERALYATYTECERAYC